MGGNTGYLAIYSIPKTLPESTSNLSVFPVLLGNGRIRRATKRKGALPVCLPHTKQAVRPYADLIIGGYMNITGCVVLVIGVVFRRFTVVS